MYERIWKKNPMQMATLTLDARGCLEIRFLTPLDVRDKHLRSGRIHGCACCPTILDLRFNSYRGLLDFSSQNSLGLRIITHVSISIYLLAFITFSQVLF